MDIFGYLHIHLMSMNFHDRSIVPTQQMILMITMTTNNNTTIIAYICADFIYVHFVACILDLYGNGIIVCAACVIVKNDKLIIKYNFGHKILHNIVLYSQ